MTECYLPGLQFVTDDFVCYRWKDSSFLTFEISIFENCNFEIWKFGILKSETLIFESLKLETSKFVLSENGHSTKSNYGGTTKQILCILVA